MRYYRKLIPKTKVVTSKGSIQFQSLDGITGYFSTANETIHAEFLLAQREQRYGISEISEEEWRRDFEDKKKPGTSLQPPSWNREEFSQVGGVKPGPVQVLGAALLAATALSGVSDIPPSIVQQPNPSSVAPQEIEVNLGTRVAK